MPKTHKKPRDLNRLAEQRLSDILKAAESSRALKKLGPPRKEWRVQVSLVGDPEIKRLNARFRHKNKVTDILSFPTPEPFWSLGLLGELIISVPVLKHQARERRLKVEEELHVLLVHGLLHLLGMDHEKSEREADKMAEWEAKLLVKSGFTECLGKGLISRDGCCGAEECCC